MMSQKPNANPLSDAEKQQIRDIVRYALWIFSAIAVALVVAAILSSIFNPEAGAGTATSSDLPGTPIVTEVPS